MVVSYSLPFFFLISLFVMSAVSLCLSSKLNYHVDRPISNCTSHTHTSILYMYTNATQTHTRWTLVHSWFAEECTHMDTVRHTCRETTQLLVSWVNLFGRNWIWQSSFSTVNNTETNEFIFSTSFHVLCTHLHLCSLFFLLSPALCLVLSLSYTLLLFISQLLQLFLFLSTSL